QAGLRECGTDMPCALAGPDHVAKPGGCVVKSANSQARVMGGCDGCIAGSQPWAEDSELGMPLGLEPVDATSNVDNSLTARGYCAADVGADGVVGPFQFFRARDVMEG